jgi:hypothetical protein
MASVVFPLVMAIAQGAPAFPAVPLWTIARASDVIAVATIVSTEAPIPWEEDYEDPTHHGQSRGMLLNMQDWWEGASDSQLVAAVGGCRAGQGDTVVAFIKEFSRDDEVPMYVLFGCVFASNGDLAVLHGRIEEARTIDVEQADGRRERMEWDLRCAEHRFTRWSGLHDLLGGGLLEKEAMFCMPPSALLTDDQRARIAQGFILERSIDPATPLLIEVMGSYADLRFDRALVVAIDDALAGGAPDLAALRAAMIAVLARLDDPRAKSRIPETLNESILRRAKRRQGDFRAAAKPASLMAEASGDSPKGFPRAPDH